MVGADLKNQRIWVVMWGQWGYDVRDARTNDISIKQVDAPESSKA